MTTNDQENFTAEAISIFTELLRDAPKVYSVPEMSEKTGIKSRVCSIVLLTLTQHRWVMMTDRGFVTLPGARVLDQAAYEVLRKSYLADIYQYEPVLPRIWSVRHDRWLQPEEQDALQF